MNRKSFDIEGEKYQFNKEAFRLIQKGMKKSGESGEAFQTRIAEKLNVSTHTVHNWLYGSGGPSDIEMIKNLALVIGDINYKALLQERKEGCEGMKITDRQLDSLKRIYDAVIDYLGEFMETNGFSSYWIDEEAYLLSSNYDREARVEEIVDNAINKVIYTVKKEFFELHNLEIYEQIEDFLYDKLYESISGKKTEPFYRMEHGEERADGTRILQVEEEYLLILDGFNSLLEPYMP